MEPKKLLALCLVVIIGIFGCIFNLSDKKDNTERRNNSVREFGSYSINFQKNYLNPEEGKAIETAENFINYTRYTNLPRFVGDRANYIDSKVIEHYNESFFNARETNQNIDVSYKYYATAKFYPELSNSNFTIDSDTIIFEINGTESHIVGGNNINFEKVYLVDSLLQYNAIWGLKEGYSVSTHQIIIMDENYNLKMIILFLTPVIVY